MKKQHSIYVGVGSLLIGMGIILNLQSDSNLWGRIGSVIIALVGAVLIGMAIGLQKTK